MNLKAKKREGFLGQKSVVLPQDVRRLVQNNPITQSLYITDIGYYPNAKHHYRIRFDGADEFILIYCLEGSGWIELEADRYELIPNSYFIIPPNAVHSYGSNESDPWSIYWLHFAGHSASEFYNRYASSSGTSQDIFPEMIKIPFEERRVKYFNRLISLLESGYGNEIIEYVNISLWQLLSSFVYHEFFSESKHQNNETSIVDLAINYIMQNLQRPISVDELADHLNYSNSYLYSIFKQKTGYSPINYFNHLKIQKACQYLSFTDMSVKEISYQLGFNDPFYFSRLFKKLMGDSPTKYRKKFKVTAK